MRILVAEDLALSARILQSQLAAWGYEPVVVRDGREAWATLERPDAPRLALLDWEMPLLEGPEVCRRVRVQAQTPYIYTILLTGRQREDDIGAGLDAGADDYVTKPFDAEDLRNRLRAVRRLVEIEGELLRMRQDLRAQANVDAIAGAKNRRALAVALELAPESERWR